MLLLFATCVPLAHATDPLPVSLVLSAPLATSPPTSSNASPPATPQPLSLYPRSCLIVMCFNTCHRHKCQPNEKYSVPIYSTPEAWFHERKVRLAFAQVNSFATITNLLYFSLYSKLNDRIRVMIGHILKLPLQYKSPSFRHMSFIS